MSDELEDWISSLENEDLFRWRLDNIKSGYFQPGVGWVYHEGDLYSQIYSLVADQASLFYSDEHEEVVVPLKKRDVLHYTDLLMKELLQGDYDPSKLHPSIRHRVLHKRKRKQRDIEREDKRQLKALSRWVIVPL